MASAKRPRLEPLESRSAELQSLLAWLRANGAQLDSVELRDDGHGGQSIFAAKLIAPGEAIAVIPVASVPTLAAARASALGLAAATAGASDRMVMWMCMALGRCEATHPWHMYLASLPAQQPGPVDWPEATLSSLQGTPIHQRVHEVRDGCKGELEAIMAKLQVPETLSQPQVVAAMTLESVLWARGTHLSRCFPAGLGSGLDVCFAPDADGDVKMPAGSRDDVGCLLPLLDMLNHRPGHQLAWEASAGQVVFRAVREIPPGQEVFTNYGGQKSNEDLLFFYGFAELDAEVSYDVVSGFVISCGVAASDTSALETLAARHQKLASEQVPCKLEGIENRGTLTLGPFSLDPAASALLPPALLQGLRLLTGDDDEELATSSNDAVKIKEQDPLLSMEAIGLLHASLRASLATEKAAPPPAEPKSRATYIRAYREGRCRIFEEALFEVEELALQHANEEEEEEEHEEDEKCDD